jgi:hypothetical protein
VRAPSSRAFLDADHSGARASAYRSLSASMRHASVAGGTSSDAGYAAPSYGGASAYFDTTVSTAALRHSQPSPTLPYRPPTYHPAASAGWTPPGARADHRRDLHHLGTTRDAVRLSAVPSLARILPDRDEDADHSRRDHSAPQTQSIDVHTANVLAKQQAQLLELHEQLRSLQEQLTHVRASGTSLGWSGGRRGGTGTGTGTGTGIGDSVDGDASVRWSGGWASSSRGWGRSSGDRRRGRAPEFIGGGGGGSDGTRDASTNTVWTPLTAEEQIAARAGAGMGTGTGILVPGDASRDGPDSDAWSYEGGGRKSRGTITDPLAGRVLAPSHRVDASLRASTRSGISVIRRSRASGPSERSDDGSDRAVSNSGPNTGPNPPPRLSPAKVSDVAATMPPLPMPSRPEMRAMQRRRNVPTEDREEPPSGPVPESACAPSATPGRIPASDVDPPRSSPSPSPSPSPSSSRSRPRSRGVDRDRGGATLPTGGVLIPSRNSAFTPVGADTNEAQGSELDRGVGRSRSSLDGVSRASTGAGSVRWSVGSDDSSVSSLAAIAAAERAEPNHPQTVQAQAQVHAHAQAQAQAQASFSPPAHLRVVAPGFAPRSFARSPLFVEGDGSPVSLREDAEEDGDSEVLRVSRDTFAEMSLRGALDARLGDGDSDGDGDGDGDAFDDAFDDDTDAGTTVTGTTTGRAGSEWAPPGRWGLQRMSEAVCWEGEENENEDEDENETDDGEDSIALGDSFRSPGVGRRGGARRASPLGPARSGSREEASEEHAVERETRWPEGMPEGMPTITYQPLSDDESSDDEEMKEILRKYNIGATR